MDRVAAASFLNISLRTLERYVQDGRIAMQRIDGKPEFTEEELLRFQKEAKSPIHVPRREKMLGFPAKETFTLFGEHAEAIAHHYQLFSLQSKLLLNLQEAEQISGLSQSFLVSKIRLRKLKAKKLGRSWKVRLKDLQYFINQEFDNVSSENLQPVQFTPVQNG